ncbi:MAG: PLP-dependent aminotransferase family protein, partial [Firmicutes bacterium]|nr:PLP-dependent aminotransferase family protein [Bacillota bacterium]
MKLEIDKNEKKPAYLQLYEQLRRQILSGDLPEGTKLPSKRTMAAEQEISVITVDHAMELLEAEGYIEIRPRSGYFVIYSDTDGFSETVPLRPMLSDAAPLPEPEEMRRELPPFPFSTYAKAMRRVIAEYGPALLIKSPNNGCLQLRTAISDYLKENRGIEAEPEQIVIGAGAEYLYGLLVHILGRNLVYAIEEPSYEKIRQVYEANDVLLEHLPLGPDGIRSEALWGAQARVLHITPYRSYPSGVTASAAKRREYIRWAEQQPVRYIIEDDVESEFTPSTKTEETVYSLSKKGCVIYLNTFTKTIAPSVRAGYMVLP